MSLINIYNHDIEEFNKKYSCNIKLLENDEPQVLNTDALDIFSGIYIGEMSDALIMADSCNKTLIVSIGYIQKNADKTLTVEYVARWSEKGKKDIEGSVKISAIDFGILLLNQVNNDRYTFKDTILKEKIYEDIIKKARDIDDMIQIHIKGESNKSKLVLCRADKEKAQIAFVSDSFVASNTHEYTIYGEQIDNDDHSNNLLYLVDRNNSMLAFSYDIAVESESSVIKIDFSWLTQANSSENEYYNENIKPLVENYVHEGDASKSGFYDNMFDW